MRFMGFNKIVIAGPYIGEINERCRIFYEDSGFKVLKVVGLGFEDLYEMGATKLSQACQIVMNTISQGNKFGIS